MVTPVMTKRFIPCLVMKITQSVLVAFASADFASESFTHPRMKQFVHRNTSPENADRRYYQLTDMMKHYKQDFDEKKMWAYGKFTLFIKPPRTVHMDRSL